MPPLTSDVSSLVASFKNEAWSYEMRLGNATRAVSQEIIDMVFPSLMEQSAMSESTRNEESQLRRRTRVLDAACGTGAFTLSLADRCAKLGSSAVDSIWATDIAPDMVSLLLKTARERGLLDHPELDDTPKSDESQDNSLATLPQRKHPGRQVPPIRAAACDAQDFTKLFPAKESFELIVTNFGIFFYPEPARGAAEMYRLLSNDESAVAVATCWREMGSWPVFLDVQEHIAPMRPLKKMQYMEQWGDGTRLKATLVEAGFEHVVLKQKKVVQWADGIAKLALGMAELYRGMLGSFWTPEEMETSRLTKVIEEILEEKKSEYLVKLDGKNDDWRSGRVGFELTAWIALARKEGPSPTPTSI